MIFEPRSEPPSNPFERTDIVVFMGGITALTAVSVEVVLPAAGVIAQSFGKPASFGALLLGLYLLAYGIGQIFWGLYSDAYGRKKSLVISLSGFLLASIVCATAPTFEVLLVGRFFQGLMAGAPVIARAMVRDVSHGSEAARILTVLGAILTIATLLAPVLGSAFLTLFTWRAIFVALAILASVFLVFTLVTLDARFGRRRPERFSVAFLLEGTGYLFGNRRFVVPAVTSGFVFGGYASLGAVGAVTAEASFGVSPEAFGALFAIGALANVSGALLASRLLKRKTLRQVGNLAFIAMFVAVVSLVSISQTAVVLSVFWISICLYIFAFGIIIPTAYASALEPAGEMPGFAASIVGATQQLAGFISALIASMLFDGSPTAICYTMALFGSAAVLVLVMGRVLDRSAS